jgi:hypothetical protein
VVPGEERETRPGRGLRLLCLSLWGSMLALWCPILRGPSTTKTRDGLGLHTSITLTRAVAAVERDDLAVTFGDLQDQL